VARYQQEHRLTLEEAARQVRYAYLQQIAEEVGAASVATGHTADDQVETISLHWLRGAGLAGTRGMAPRSVLHAVTFGQAGTASPLSVVRPLLDVTRAETEAYCAEHALAFRQDASNQDQGMLRNRLRLRLLPELERYNPNLRATLLRAAAAAADDYDCLHRQVLTAWPEVVLDGPRAPNAGPLAFASVCFSRPKYRALHPALQRGLLREALRRLYGGWQDFGWTHLESARQAVVRGRVGAVVHLPHDLALAVDYAEAVIGLRGGPGDWRSGIGENQPQLHVDSLPVAVPGRTELPETAWRLEVVAVAAPPYDSSRFRPPASPIAAHVSGDSPAAERAGLCADVDAAVVGSELYLRRPQPGDRFQPLGMAGSKKLQDLFVDVKVPRSLRAGLPVLASSRGIIWVAGRFLSEWAKVRPETRRLLRLSYVTEALPWASKQGLSPAP
jgi:tRNA(Ile)-lysidine synthase